MSATPDARDVLERIERTKPNNTQLRALAKELKKNHPLAVELWKSGGFSARMLSFLLLDLKAVDVAALESMIADLEKAEGKEQSQLLDWLIANVVMKKAALKAGTATWRDDPSTLRQRTFWSVQARSVRGGEHEHNEQLLAHIERAMPTADEKVRWNMNWTAAQIGIADEALRARCIALGERLGFYKDYPVSKGCTSPYLPIWIDAVVGKKATA